MPVDSSQVLLWIPFRRVHPQSAVVPTLVGVSATPRLAFCICPNDGECNLRLVCRKKKGKKRVDPRTHVLCFLTLCTIATTSIIPTRGTRMNENSGIAVSGGAVPGV